MLRCSVVVCCWCCCRCGCWCCSCLSVCLKIAVWHKYAV
uniref:Uncharacterized protein n=1 Tax=Anguilla anguilla TaxID=7936 RepID=A0A0E9R5Q9_ANGAN